MQGSVSHDVGGASGKAAAGRIPFARDVNAYGESRTRDLYYAMLDQRKTLARHGITLRFAKPADHPLACVVFDLGYGAVEVKWSDTYGYYRYFYAYEYSNSGTRKFEKVLLREPLGRTTDDVKATLLDRLADNSFTNGCREIRGASPRRRGTVLGMIRLAGAIAAALGTGGALLIYTWH